MFVAEFPVGVTLKKHPQEESWDVRKTFSGSIGWGELRLCAQGPGQILCRWNTVTPLLLRLKDRPVQHIPVPDSNAHYLLLWCKKWGSALSTSEQQWVSTEIFLTLLTFFQHSHFKAFHKATGLTRFASPFRDLTLVCGGTAVFYVTWGEKQSTDHLSPTKDRNIQHKYKKKNQQGNVTSAAWRQEEVCGGGKAATVLEEPSGDATLDRG